LNTEHSPLYGIRYKDGEREPFSLLAEAVVDTDGTSPDSRIYQTITATIAVGSFGRQAIFATRDFEIVAELALFGVAHDFEETFCLHRFNEAFCCGSDDGSSVEIEVFDMISDEVVQVSANDPRLADIVEQNSLSD
jgi:hypothetical protein